MVQWVAGVVAMPFPVIYSGRAPRGFIFSELADIEQPCRRLTAPQLEVASS